MNKFDTELDGRPVTVVGPIETDDDRRDLRADTAFHDGTIVVLTYPSETVAFYGTEPPRMAPVPPGSYLAKGEAGDFRVLLPTALTTLATPRP